MKFYKKEDFETKEKIISTFPSESPYKIYNIKYWWSDKWGAEDYERDYDFSRLFFEQFQKLNLDVPHPAITHYLKGVIDSPYTISILYSKNCYLATLCSCLENVHYSSWSGFCKDSMELDNVTKSQICSELISCNNCYNCHFCQECRQCIDSYFLYSCKNCQNCFGCTNLRHKSYCFFNEQFSKEEYLEKIKTINLGNREILEEYKEKFEELFKNTFRQNLNNGRQNLNCLGDQLYGAKNCFQVFRAVKGVENVRYSTDMALGIKDGMDLYIACPKVSLGYELIEIVESNNIKFSFFGHNNLEIEYCIGCYNCQNCFGCVGLRNKSCYIFNKQYLKEKYYKFLDKIKTKMLKDKEYGEFFFFISKFTSL